MAKNKTSYEFLDIELLNSLVEKQDNFALISYAHNLQKQTENIPQSKLSQFRKELKVCQGIVANSIFSLKDEKLISKYIYSFLNNIDPFPEVYEKICAKLIKDKSPEEALELYILLSKQLYLLPSDIILKYISSNTKKSDTCLFFIKDLEQTYQKYGNHLYDKHILNFYKRFRAVCSKKDFEQFIDSGMQNENNLQKQ